MTPETKAILLRLADLAPTIPRNEFKLDVWFCGTHGCLIGHAIKRGLIPGLGYITGDFNEMIPICGRKVDFNAVALALDITRKDAEYLFAPDKIENYDGETDGFSRKLTREELAIHIRDYVAAHS